ncbi:MAG: electron transfer flavoprotein subunit alpha/FixB family protein [Bacteroidetes bacterium]|nr:electron transfer flavoprotein subunit alpha/FixB family protein [Bacteroidota bacterium]
MSNRILAFVESKDGKFKNSAFEVVSEAKKISGELGCEFEVLTIGSGIDAEAENLGSYGASKVLVVDLNDLNSKSKFPGTQYSHSAFAKVVAETASQKGANIILISGTGLGKEIAPRVAIKTDSAFCQDCVALHIDGGNIIATKPVYAGKSMIDMKFNGDKILITLRPNVFKPVKSGDAKAAIEKVDVGSLNLTDKDFSSAVKEVVVSSEKLDVAEADIIVSGGRGLRGPENFHLVETLAGVLGAATGASRAVVDAGWRGHGEQVGQTGKTVSPSLYIAVGISGAIQHLAGMSSSKTIVAINKDKDAPIFQIADYGMVGDAFEIVPALTDEFKKVLGS